jgi:Spy/CpxP family protein refolding chaperone
MQTGLHPTRESLRRPGRLTCGLVAAAALAGCASAPSPAATTQQVAPPPTPNQQAQVYVYPAGGQDERQLDRDRYECHRWAVRQSSFDPSLPGLPPQQRVQVVRAGPPPGAQVAAGAVTGAVIGAAVSNPWEQGEGALIGAAAGAVIGAVAESSQTRQVQAVQDQYDQAAVSEQEQRAGQYRRAISACLEGRGYSVR